MKTHTCEFCGTTYEVYPGLNSCPGMEGLCAAEWYEPAGGRAIAPGRK